MEQDTLFYPTGFCLILFQGLAKNNGKKYCILFHLILDYSIHTIYLNCSVFFGRPDSNIMEETTLERYIG